MSVLLRKRSTKALPLRVCTPARREQLLSSYEDKNDMGHHRDTDQSCSRGEDMPEFLPSPNGWPLETVQH